MPRPRARASLAALLAALLAAAPVAAPLGAQGNAPAASAAVDSTRRQLPMLGVLQGLQVVNVPELAAAVNALLADTSAHMRMAPRRAATAADSARAAAVVRQARAALAPYADVARAERDGYVRFLPWLEEQPIYHYNSVANVFAAFGAFDAARPVSLLYKKDAAGALALVGAMYSAPPFATPDELDARLPLGIAHWHEHVDFCAPPRDSVRAPADATPAAVGSPSGVRVDGAAMARYLAITTREACGAAGGRFVPRLFGWMAHVYLFAGDDPAAVWGGEGHDQMHMHRKSR